MKHEPVRKPVTPQYPTLGQMKKASFGTPLSKVAAVTAVTAALALSAGCGEDESGNRHFRRFGLADFKDPTIDTTVIDGEIEIGGDETVVTTEEVIMGEEPTYTEDTYLGGAADVYTEPTDYYIEGDVQIDPDYTEPTESYILEGGEVCEVEDDMDPSETT